jgi:hypothetical protein
MIIVLAFANGFNLIDISGEQNSALPLNTQGVSYPFNHPLLTQHSKPEIEISYA